MCPIVVLPDFSKFFLVRFSVRSGQVFRKPCLIALRSIYVVVLNSSAWRYCASSGLVVWARILFASDSYCCVSRGTSHIPVCLFLVPFIISCPFLWTVISCLSSVVVHPQSHNTPNDISGGVLILGVMWLCLDCFCSPGIWSVSMCDDSIVIPSCRLYVVSFEIMTGTIVVADFFDRCIFAPESSISSLVLLGEFGGFPIQFIKLVLGLLISILFIISPNRHLYPFLIPPSWFFCYAYSLWTNFLSDQV